MEKLEKLMNLIKEHPVISTSIVGTVMAGLGFYFGLDNGYFNTESELKSLWTRCNVDLMSICSWAGFESTVKMYYATHPENEEAVDAYMTENMSSITDDMILNTGLSKCLDILRDGDPSKLRNLFSKEE